MKPAVCLAVFFLIASCSLFGPRDSGAHDSTPAWSPDGKTIAYVRRPGQYYPPIDPDPAGLYLIGANGRGNRVLLLGRWYAAPTWSPDGRWLVFLNRRDGQLYKVKTDGDSLIQLTFAGRNYHPTWSVADRIAFESDMDHPRMLFAIWVMDSDGSNMRPLQPLSDPDHDDGFPSWSPDGSHLVFCRWSLDQHYRVSELMVIDSAGRELTRLTRAAYVGPLAWSPDGGCIAICGSIYIRILDLETINWTDLPASEGAVSLTWSPDGQMLCFEVSGAETPEQPSRRGDVGRYLWIIRKDGTGLRRLTR